MVSNDCLVFCLILMEDCRDYCRAVLQQKVELKENKIGMDIYKEFCTSFCLEIQKLRTRWKTQGWNEWWIKAILNDDLRG